MSTAATALDHVFMDTGDAGNPVYIDSENGSVYGSTHGGSQDSTTPRASRCPSPATELQREIATGVCSHSEKEGGKSVDPENQSASESADESEDDENMSDADSQYETDAEDQYDGRKNTPIRERTLPPQSNKDPIEGLVGMQSDAIRRAMRANKVLKTGARAVVTQIRSHTRGQNDAASKQSVRELADEVKDLKRVMTNFFTAMGKKEEVDEHRWVGLHEAWLNAKNQWNDTLKHMEAM